MTHADDKAGWHRFGEGRDQYGSFEVYYLTTENSPVDADGGPLGAGWYWHACFPGCVPDSESYGPFATSDDAHADAQAVDY